MINNAIKILKSRLKELETASKIVRMDNSQERFKLPILNIIKAIEELEQLQKSIDSSIEEIEYALSKPQYADVYLNNAIRFLKNN